MEQININFSSSHQRREPAYQLLTMNIDCYDLSLRIE